MTKPKAVSLKVAAERCGMSYCTARRRMSQGTFPVPALPRHGKETHKFSESDIDRYLANGATADARVGA